MKSSSIRKPLRSSCRGECLESRTLFAAPTILSEQFVPDGTPKLVARFTTNVQASIDASTLILQDRNNLTTFQATADSTNQITLASYDIATNTATWTFPKYAKNLPDGNYRAILYGERITDAGGVAMATDSMYDFAVFNGDVSSDGKVNALDFAALASNYGKTSRVYSQGDMDFNGTVNSADFTKLSARFNQTSPGPTPIPRRMSVVTFNNNTDGSDRYTQSMFDVHNTSYPGGYFFFMGSDAHRSEIQTQGNRLAIYFNNFNKSPLNITDPSYMIGQIRTWSLQFTTTGQMPTWIAMNEISGGTWPSSADYRTWVRTVVHALKVQYGMEVILFAPFSNPGANSSDWTALAQDAYIGVENYLSGAEMKAQNFSVSWAKSQYQSSITSYAARGVPASRIVMAEEFALSTAGNGWGRDGVSYADWDSTVIARAAAQHQVGQVFGTIGYAWGKNNMLDTLENQTHFIATYRAQALP